MQGFLRVFGVPSPTKPGVFVIEVSVLQHTVLVLRILMCRLFRLRFSNL